MTPSSLLEIRWCSRLRQTLTFHEYVRLISARASLYLLAAAVHFLYDFMFSILSIRFVMLFT